MKISGSSWQHYRNEPALTDVDIIDDFPNDNDNNSNVSFKSKPKITAQTGNDRTKDVEITVALKHLDNFWRIFKMPLINCKINLILANCIIDAYPDDGQVSTFAITDTKRYVPVVTLSTHDNVKLLQQLKSGLKKNNLEYISIKSNNIWDKPLFRLFIRSNFSRSK